MSDPSQRHDQSDLSELSGRQVLVVEDDYFIAVELARTLEKMGARVIGPVASVKGALDLIESAEELDGAVLDIHLGHDRVFPVVDVLTRRAVPFIFLTGYDAIAIPEIYAAVPRVPKPLDRTLLVRTLKLAGVT